jgi:hypothetical protein
MAEDLTPEHFELHLHKTFHVKDSRHALILSAIDRRRREEWEHAMEFREPFNLVFRGEPGAVLPEGLYTLEVQDGPSFELYVIPVHSPALDRQNYQASFN